MDKITIQKNKGEIFKCQFTVEGASMEDAVVRLCLEFDDNKNLFFYGRLKQNGECIVEIPKLKELDAKEGLLTVEAIVDSVYFKLYESPVEIKNPIEVTMVQTPKIKQTVPETSVKLEGFVRDKPKIAPIIPVIEEQEEEPEKVVNPYVLSNLHKIPSREEPAPAGVEELLRRAYARKK
jgi:hypothetical protein